MRSGLLTLLLGFSSLLLVVRPAAAEGHAHAPLKEDAADSLQRVVGLLDEALEAHERKASPRPPHTGAPVPPHIMGRTPYHRMGKQETTSLLARNRGTETEAEASGSPVLGLLTVDMRKLQGDQVPGESSRRLLEAKAQDIAKVDAIWQLSEALKELGRTDAELQATAEHGKAFDHEVKNLVGHLKALADKATEELRVSRLEAKALRERVKALEMAAKGERMGSNDPVDAVFQKQHQEDQEAAEKLKQELEALKAYAAKQTEKAGKNQKEASTSELLAKWLAKEKQATKPLREEVLRLRADRAALSLQVKELTASDAERFAEQEAKGNGISLEAEISDKLRACELDRDLGKRNFEERLQALEKEKLLQGV